jgi:hypothetical protein
LLGYLKEVLAELSPEQKSRVIGYADGLVCTEFRSVGPMYRHGFIDAVRGDTERLRKLIPMVGE